MKTFFIIQETGTGPWSILKASEANLRKHFGVFADTAEIFDTKEEAITAKEKANKGIDDAPRKSSPEHLDHLGAYID